MKELTRRDFFRISAATGGSLIIGFSLGACQSPTPTPAFTPIPETTVEPTAEATFTPLPAPTAAPTPTGPLFQPNAFVRIDTDGTVTLTIHRSEMGQAVQTALAMILAEELSCDWNKVRVEQAPADGRYGDQVTGGSVSISGSYDTLRQAGALAHDLLITAAAQQWSLAKETLWAENGIITHRPSGKKVAFGELVERASALPLPKGNIVLKNPQDFKLVGTRVGQISNLDMVTGRATFGLDVRVPGMLYAAVARSPVLGGKVASYDAGPARSLPGVRAVVQIESGVAVVADNTYHAIQGRDALKLQWDEGPNTALTSDGIREQLLKMIEEAKAKLPPASGQVFESYYEVPYLAHATMEPMNATAHVRAGSCDVWAPTQDRQQALRVTGQLTGLPNDAIQIHVPLIGGGLGRRLMVDYVAEAVQVSKAVNAPVQVVWTRADDIQHDYFRPASVHYVRAELGRDTVPVFWRHLIASQGVTGTQDIVAGAQDMPYRMGAVLVTPLIAKLPVPTGYWRGVYNSQNAFVNEALIDEIAIATRQDPYAYRLRMLSGDSPMRRVLETAGSKSGFGTPFIPQGQFRGMACHTTWGATPVAMVAEASVSKEGLVRVHRVVCGLDCGLAVDPDMVEAQIEGGIIVGLNGLLKGQITIKNGRVEQSGFADYPIPTLVETPVIQVHILPSTRPPTGVGEMAGPVIVPAVVNAVAAATGKRIRRLPIRPEDCKT